MKLDRLLAITMLLLNRKRVSAKELAERFEVSLRTVYRDVEAINQAGIPIVSYAGTAGGYEIMESYRLERQYLSMEELQSIMAALKGIRSTFDEPDITRLLEKVGALMSGSGFAAESETDMQLLIDLTPWQSGPEEKEKLSRLRQAVRDAKLIRFAYTNSQGDASERDCEPMSLVLKGYAWYLSGYCRLREEIRIFRLSRMERLTVLAESFTRRQETPDRLDYRRTRHNGRDYVRLVLRFHPRAKPKVRDYFVHGDIVTEPDGSLLVTAVQPEEPWLYGMLLSYGADVRILEPASVARAVKAKAQEIVDLYEPILT